MKAVFWLLILASVAACGWLLWYSRRKWQERQHIEETRAAEFLAQVTGAAARKDPSAPAAQGAAPAIAPAASPLPPKNDIALQKLLFEAAHKAGEAGEPALAIQLYARLLARYPASAFAAEARAAAAAQKKKLVKA